LGLIAFSIDWDFETAEAEFQLAHHLNPGYATAHHWYTFVLEATGRREEAIDVGRKSRHLDPLSPIITWNLANLLLGYERYDEALALFQEAAQLGPEIAHVHGWLGVTLALLGRHEEAIVAVKRAIALEEEGSRRSAYPLALLDALRGDSDSARRQLEALQKEDDFHPSIAAWIATELGDHELALDFLEEAYEAHSWHLPGMFNWNRMRVLHDHPRYQELRRKMGIPIRK
jgi:tetratricopeptide (TPR) repeat protein